jgi:hypothetical protein
MDTKSFGMIVRIIAISANNLAVALSESVSAGYVPFRTAFDAGMFARYPNL